MLVNAVKWRLLGMAISLVLMAIFDDCDLPELFTKE